MFFLLVVLIGFFNDAIECIVDPPKLYSFVNLFY